MDYIASIGYHAQPELDVQRVPHPTQVSLGGNANADRAVSPRRAAIIAAHAAIHEHERAITRRMLSGLQEIPGLKIYGITDPARLDERCATLAVRIDGHTPLQLATKLGERGIFTWDGNYYAINVSEALGVEKSGGFLRIGFVHYNTMDEADRTLTALREITAESSTD